ncbi:calmodulin [Acrasis kona]|uniref:Calmodulin n=1 Tax=Acrasis kona TaxID=1008807 RepID=A0AAW2YSJ4_9EUKA
MSKKKIINPREVLKNEQVEEYKEAFNLFLSQMEVPVKQGNKKDQKHEKNKKQSGSITLEVLGSIMRSLMQDPSETELKEMVQEVDEDGNGEIDFDEFLTLMVSKNSQLQEVDEMKEAFKVFDRTNQGYITTEAFKDIFSHIGQPLTEEECRSIIIENDSTGSFENGAGEPRLFFDDFLKLMQQPGVDSVFVPTDIKANTTKQIIQTKLLSKQPTQMFDDEVGEILNVDETSAQARMKNNQEVDEMKEAFKIFDKKNQGYITVEGLREVFLEIGQRLTDDECRELINQNDCSGTSEKGESRLCFEDFLRMMNQPKSENSFVKPEAKTQMVQKMMRRRKWEEEAEYKEQERQKTIIKGSQL